MPILVQKNKCCGCSACANICPVDCISMEADETGFAFPVIDSLKCIDCKKCEKACPAFEHKERRYCIESDGTRYIVQNKSEEILEQSTSGGAFTAFAEKIIEEDGVVFGAYMDKGFHVKHTAAKKIEELKIFRNSKYVQSTIGYTYRECYEYLKEGKRVLFSGTPCQIAGLKRYLGKEYDNLLLVDVMCHAVPSPKLFEKYIELCKIRFSNIEELVFRDKAFGYSYTTMAVYGEKKGKRKIYRRSRYFDEWYRLFFGGYCNRETCYTCSYQYGKRESDITIWDCYETYEIALNLDNNKGATNLIAWTEKGNNMVKNIQDKLKINKVIFDPFMKSLYRGENYSGKRDVPDIYKDADSLPVKEFFNKYTPVTINLWIMEFIRRLLLRLRLHDPLRKLVHKIRKRIGE